MAAVLSAALLLIFEHMFLLRVLSDGVQKAKHGEQERGGYGSKVLRGLKKGNFVQLFSVKLFPEQLMSLFGDAGKRNMVAVSLVTIERPEDEPSVIPKCVLTLTLHGKYAGINGVLDQVLSKRKDVVIEHLALRHTGNAAELEAQLRLILLSRPQPVGAGG